MEQFQRRQSRLQPTSVCCGGHHTACIGEVAGNGRGLLLTWGGGAFGKLGHGSRAAHLLPTLVGELARKTSTFSDLSCVNLAGCSQWQAQQKSQKRGAGATGSTGTATTASDKAPDSEATSNVFPVYQYSRKQKDARMRVPLSIAKVALGAHHSGCLGSGGEVFIWGQQALQADELLPRRVRLRASKRPVAARVAKAKERERSSDKKRKKHRERHRSRDRSKRDRRRRRHRSRSASSGHREGDELAGSGAESDERRAAPYQSEYRRAVEEGRISKYIEDAVQGGFVDGDKRTQNAVQVLTRQKHRRLGTDAEHLGTDGEQHDCLESDAHDGGHGGAEGEQDVQQYRGDGAPADSEEDDYWKLFDHEPAGRGRGRKSSAISDAPDYDDEDERDDYEHVFAVDMALGHSHCAVIADTGDVYSWGVDRVFSHGDFNAPANVPTCIDVLRGKSIVQVSCGISHTLALSDKQTLTRRVAALQARLDRLICGSYDVYSEFGVGGLARMMMAGHDPRMLGGRRRLLLQLSRRANQQSSTFRRAQARARERNDRNARALTGTAQDDTAGGAKKRQLPQHRAKKQMLLEYERKAREKRGEVETERADATTSAAGTGSESEELLPDDAELVPDDAHKVSAAEILLEDQETAETGREHNGTQPYLRRSLAKFLDETKQKMQRKAAMRTRDTDAFVVGGKATPTHQQCIELQHAQDLSLRLTEQLYLARKRVDALVAEKSSGAAALASAASKSTTAPGSAEPSPADGDSSVTQRAAAMGLSSRSEMRAKHLMRESKWRKRVAELEDELRRAKSSQVGELVLGLGALEKSLAAAKESRPFESDERVHMHHDHEENDQDGAAQTGHTPTPSFPAKSASGVEIDVGLDLGFLDAKPAKSPGTTDKDLDSILDF